MSNIQVSRTSTVGIIRLDRPHVKNALSMTCLEQLVAAVQTYSTDSTVRVIVITGSESVFCAGADLKELRTLDFGRAYGIQWLRDLKTTLAAVQKPLIAAVNGAALGIGCELALMCDLIYAGDTAEFGLPEVKVGTIPGGGGTQRMIKAIGKTKAMHMILTGETMTAFDAENAGLVAKLYKPENLMDRVVEIATKIASYSMPIVAIAKESINASEDMGLQAGLHLESRLYYGTFSLDDFKEGANAFLEKRQPKWVDK